MRAIEWFGSLIALSVVVSSSPHATAEELFVSKRLTPKGEYTNGVEGPAVAANGDLFVANLVRSDAAGRRAIGRVPSGSSKSEFFAFLPPGSVANGIRFGRDGRMFVADFKAHTIFFFEPGSTAPVPYFQSNKFAQPNDLAVAADGVLFASDPDFKHKGGRIWRITKNADGGGNGVPLATPGKTLKVPNGLDLSPDGSTLYVSESATNDVWSFRIAEGQLLEPKRLIHFKDGELDGLRTDLAGNIHVARQTVGKISVVAPDGKLLREIATTGKQPSNLTFGGPDGRTVYVTQVDGRYVESYRVDIPGREPCLQTGGAACRRD